VKKDVKMGTSFIDWLHEEEKTCDMRSAWGKNGVKGKRKTGWEGTGRDIEIVDDH